MRITGFDPIIGPNPRILVLGSIPGRRSLELGQYYGHRRNAFWPIMADLGLSRIEDAYPLRLDALKQAGVALWDVLERCERSGSLDASIAPGSEQMNPLGELLARQSTIRAVFFNGAKAEALFRRYILSRLSDERVSSIAFQRLPSTSPAHAIPYADKLKAWQVIVRYLDYQQ
jgi:hypoxanthine-DNA glycosylase